MPRRGRSFETEALVTGSRRYRDADQILTFYTRARGRLSALAKGLRRPKSRLGGRLEPFSLVTVSLYEGRGSLYTVTGAETIRTFQRVRDSLFRIEEGARLLDDVRRHFPEEEGNEAAFNLLVRAVGRLGMAEDRQAAGRVVLAARLKLLVAHGYLPALGSCRHCGSDEFLCALDPSLGGVICRSCYEAEAGDCFSLGREGLVTMQELLRRPLEESVAVPVSQAARGDVERTITRVFDYHGH
ncbi:MAG: hypothetical protein Kow00129_12390 [Thermoleophilia bacterium]